MDKETYISRTLKIIRCDRSKKREIAQQLSSDIDIAMEQGESWESIQRRQGTPEELAREFNENLDTNGRSRKSKIILAAAAFLFVTVCAIGIFLTTRKENISQTQGQEGQETLSIKEGTELGIQVREYFDSGDYEALVKLSDVKMQEEMPVSVWEETKSQYGSVLGAFEADEKTAVTYTTMKGESYAVVTLRSKYEKSIVIYTITLNKDGQLSGFYLNPIGTGS